MDNVEREQATLLIRVAKQVGNDVDRRALLTWAEELLSGAETTLRKANAGITFPVSIFARPKGKRHDALLLQGWKVQMNGKHHRSPSAAATAIAGYPVNGWRFWRYRNETGDERPIDDLRK